MTRERRSLLDKLFGAFARVQPPTVKATVSRSFLRPDGRYAASVEKPNGDSVYVLTDEVKLNPGQSVKIRPASCGWELC